MDVRGRATIAVSPRLSALSFQPASSVRRSGEMICKRFFPPGLKARASCGPFQGPEGPCSLREELPLRSCSLRKLRGGGRMGGMDEFPKGLFTLLGRMAFCPSAQRPRTGDPTRAKIEPDEAEDEGLWRVHSRGRQQSMARFSPQPFGPGPIFPISLSFVANRHPVCVTPCF